MSFQRSTVGSLRESTSSASVYLLRPFVEFVLPSHLIELLSAMYATLYGEALGTISQVCTKSARISFDCHTLCSTLTKTERGSCIAAQLIQASEDIHIGIVQYYFDHNVVVKDRVTSHTVAWFEPHPVRHFLDSPLEVWRDSFKEISLNSFVLASNILYPVAYAKDRLETQFGSETVVITLPLAHITS